MLDRAPPRQTLPSPTMPNYALRKSNVLALSGPALPRQASPRQAIPRRATSCRPYPASAFVIVEPKNPPLGALGSQLDARVLQRLQ